jgi:hypothetical protein
MNTLESLSAKLFNMTDETWERHANPWSVWTRYACLPLFVLAISSYAWIGYTNLILIVLIGVWCWLNPRVFGKPRSTNNWASKSVLGERVLLAGDKGPIPRHHKTALSILKFLMLLGVFTVVTGYICEEIALVWLGVCIVILAKSWFLDRMVWLYDEMSNIHVEYKEWLY